MNSCQRGRTSWIIAIMINVNDVYDNSAKDALRHFNITPNALELLHVSENITYRASDVATGKSVALRLHRPKYQCVESLRSERIWMNALATSGIEVPIPIKTVTGEYIVNVSVDSLNETRWASANDWVDGSILGKVLRTSSYSEKIKYFEQVGTLLAKMHNLSLTWREPNGFFRRKLDADGLVGDRPVWGQFWKYPILTSNERDILFAAKECIYKSLLQYGQDSNTFGLIHADMHSENIILTDRGLVPIDFDDAAYGWYMFDLAIVLIGHCSDIDLHAYKSACVAGYRSVRILPDRDYEMLSTFLIARGMLNLGWFYERPEIQLPSYFDELKRWVCTSAESYLTQGGSWLSPARS